MLWISIGSFLAIGGALIWSTNEDVSTRTTAVVVASLMIFIGGLLLLYGLIRPLICKDKCLEIIDRISNWRYTLYVIALIYMGSVFYTFASFGHFKLEKWTFSKALMIAVVAVLLEYQFTLRANYFANSRLKLTNLQIVLIIMCCDFVNSLLLNRFYLKDKIVWWRDLIAFAMVVGAFCLSYWGGNKPSRAVENTAPTPQE